MSEAAERQTTGWPLGSVASTQHTDYRRCTHATRIYAMKHRITITAVPKPEPDLDRFVAALLALALARLEAAASEEKAGEDGDV